MVLRFPGLTGADPVARRRLRRGTARVRPWALPAAVLVAALVVAGRSGPAVPTAAAVPPLQVPVGRVLVVVQPAEPAVLQLAVPGSVVDVYGAPASFAAEGATAPALLLVSAAVVVGEGAGTVDGSADAGGGPVEAGVVGPLGDGPLAGTPAPGAVTLAVTDAEAASLAAQQGSGLTLAVRPGGGGQG